MSSSQSNDSTSGDCPSDTSVSYRMMEELEPLPDSILERVRSKFYSMVERMENAPSVIGSLTPEQKKRVFSSDEGETNGPPARLCVFCLKSERDKTPWCASNPGLGCTYGLGHDYGDLAPLKPVSKQPKRPSGLCTKGLHPKNPASKTNGCEHSYDVRPPRSPNEVRELMRDAGPMIASSTIPRSFEQVSALDAEYLRGTPTPPKILIQVSIEKDLDNPQPVRYYKERDDEDIISLLFADKTRKILRGGPYGEKKTWVIEYEFTHNGSVEKYQLPLDKHKVLLHRLAPRR